MPSSTSGDAGDGAPKGPLENSQTGLDRSSAACARTNRRAGLSQWPS